MTQPVIRVFISSPSDVSAERRRAALAIERLNGEFAGRVSFEAILWEEHFYSSHAGFQDQIAEAATCDIVIAIFGARLGTPLPESFPHNPDTGEPYPSGTAYEVLSAIQARKAGQDLPDIYVFRYPSSPQVQIDAPDRTEVETQWTALKSFFEAWFRGQGGEFIAAFHEYASTDDFATQVEGCLRDFLGRHGFVTQGPVWDRLRLGTPFPGLAAFEADRRAVFFGRDRAITQALDRLRAAESEPGRLPFLLVIGASGSGKSSLLRAGLMPRLTTPGTIPQVDLWRGVVITPGRDPFLSLAEALFADTVLGQELRAGTFASKEMLARQLAAEPDLAVAPVRAALGLAAQERMAQAKFATVQPARVALGIDQAERLFAETAPDIAERFAALLVGLAESGLATVILTLRSDAYGRFQSVPPLLALREAGADFDLVPPGADELEQIIAGPVQACDPKLAFEAGLAARLAEDAMGGDALPLLQVALARLYDAQAKRNDGILRHADYLGMGEAVTSTARAALQGLPPDAVNGLPALVAAMVSDVTTDPVTSRPIATIVPLDRSQFTRDQPARDQLLDAFITSRLLTADGAGDQIAVRPTHEALLRIWPKAVELVTELGPMLRVRRALASLVRDWQEALEPDKPKHLEISPALLEGAQQLVARLDVNPSMAEFVAACAAAAEARRRQALQEQERRIRDAEALAAARRRTAQFAGAGLIAALLLAGAAGWQWRLAVEARREATSAEQATAENLRVAQINQARFVAGRVRETFPSDPEQARLALLEVLPKTGLADDRPLMDDVVAELDEVNEQDRVLTIVRGGGAPSWSPDSRSLAVPDVGKSITVITLPLGAAEHVLPWKGDYGYSKSFHIAWSPDSRKFLLPTETDRLEVWDLAPERMLVAPPGRLALVPGRVWSPDSGKIVTLLSDNTARVWNAVTGAEVAKLSGHSDSVLSATWKPDGTLITTASADGSIRVWDATNWTLQGILHASETSQSPEPLSIYFADWSPDGTNIAAALSNNTVQIWNMATGRSVAGLATAEQPISFLSWSPDGSKILTATSNDHSVQIWDVPTQHLGNRVSGNVCCDAWSNDGKEFITTGEPDQRAKIWSATTGKLVDSPGNAETVAWSPDGTMLALSAANTTTVLRAARTKTVLTGHKSPLTAATWSADGTRIATASADDTAIIWDGLTGTPVLSLSGHAGEIKSIVWSPDGTRIVTASQDATARIWDASTGRSTFVLKMAYPNTAVSAEWSPDGTNVATVASDGGVRIWDAATGQMIADLPVRREDQLNPPSDSHSLVGWSPDGKHFLKASEGSDGVPILETHSWKQVLNLKDSARGFDPKDAVREAAWSPNGTRIVTVTYGAGAVLWDTRTEHSLALPSHNSSATVAVAWSPDGTRVVTADDDGTAQMWDSSSGRLVLTISGHNAGLTAVEWSPDAKWVATSSEDHTVRIWDAETGRLVKVLIGHQDSVVSVAWNRSTTGLVTASRDGTARVWRFMAPIQPQTAVFASEFRPFKVLTQRQREALYLQEPQASPAQAKPSLDPCDLFAASFNDPLRPPGVGIHPDDIDPSKAVAACRAAVQREPGVVRFRYELARALTRSDDKTEWPKLMKEAADAGYPIAILQIGMNYEAGQGGVERNFAEARKYFTEALDGGAGFAAYQLGLMAWVGSDRPADSGDAMRVWNTGAAIGDPHCNEILAWVAESGRNGTPLDPQAALYHYAIATKLLEASGDMKSAEAARLRRGTLARALRASEVAAIWPKVRDWVPSAH